MRKHAYPPGAAMRRFWRLAVLLDAELGRHWMILEEFLA